MRPSIAIVDYKAGNLTSVIKGFHTVGAELRTIVDVNDLEGAEAIVIPGVGHFSVTAALGPDWQTAVSEMVGHGIPLLGICVGLQWLFEGSEEAPAMPGFGLMPGRCFRLSGQVKVPHVGWNTLGDGPRRSRLLEGLPADSSAYFTHSYAAPVGADTVAITEHGVPFAAAIERDRVFGVQFHPEKSGPTGLRMLENFVRIVQGGR